MVDDFMLDDGIIKNKGHLGADILNNIIKNLSIADEAIEEACHEINKHDELYEMHFESFENDIQDFNKFRWEYEEFTSYADEYDAMVDSNYKSRMESICEQLSDIRLENITIDNNLGIVDSEGSHYATFEGTRLKHKINIEDVLGVEHVDKAMKAEYEERRQMVQAMQKMVEEDNWPEGTSEDTKEAIRQYLSNLNGGKMESYDDEIKNLLTKGEFNFITDKEQNLSLALDFVPLVGDIKGVIEAIKGKEMITNRELSDEEKTMAGISSAVGFIPVLGKAGTLAKAGGKLGAKAMIKDAAKYTVKETIKGAGMYGATSVASDLAISPRQQIMAMGGISLYRGGKAVLKNPKVVSAVNNTVDITKATVKDAIESNKGSAILSSNLGGYGGQLYNSLKKVTAERKALREGIASGESSISRVPENINNIKLKEVNIINYNTVDNVVAEKNNIQRLIPGVPGTVTGGDSNKLGKNIMESMGLKRSTKWKGHQAQHIIPAEMADHPIIQKIGMDLDNANNGILLRTPSFNISAMSRHRGYHSIYNETVKNELNKLDINQSINTLENQVFELQNELRILQESGVPLYPSQGATLDLWERSLERIRNRGEF